MDNAQSLQDPVTPEQRGERPSQGTARVTGKGQSSCPRGAPCCLSGTKKKKTGEEGSLERRWSKRQAREAPSCQGHREFSWALPALVTPRAAPFGTGAGVPTPRCGR